MRHLWCQMERYLNRLEPIWKKNPLKIFANLEGRTWRWLIEPLSITIKWTDQTFYCQFNQLAIVLNSLLVQPLVACRCPVVSRECWQCLTQLLSEPAKSKAKTCSPKKVLGATFCSCFIVKMPPNYDKLLLIKHKSLFSISYARSRFLYFFFFPFFFWGFSVHHSPPDFVKRKLISIIRNADISLYSLTHKLSSGGGKSDVSKAFGY